MSGANYHSNGYEQQQHYQAQDSSYPAYSPPQQQQQPRSYTPQDQRYDASQAYSNVTPWYSGHQANTTLSRAAEALSTMSGNLSVPTATTRPPSVSQAQARYATSTQSTGPTYGRGNPYDHQRMHNTHAQAAYGVSNDHSWQKSADPSGMTNATANLQTQHGMLNNGVQQYPSITQRIASPAQASAAHNSIANTQRHSVTPVLDSKSVAAPAVNRASTWRESPRPSQTAGYEPPQQALQRVQEHANLVTSAPKLPMATAGSLGNAREHDYVRPDSTSATTVDPRQVYDPWPEFQRRKAAHDAQIAQQRREVSISQGIRSPQIESSSYTTNTIHVNVPAEAARQAAPNVQPADATEQTNGALEADEQNQRVDTHDVDEDELKMLRALREMKAKNPALLQQLLTGLDKDPTSTAAPSPPVESHVSSGPANHTMQADTSRTKKQPMPRQTSTVQTGKAVRGVMPKAAETALAASTPDSLQQTGQKSSTAVGTSAEKTIWPPEKKQALGHAAASYLNRLPANASRNIQRAEIVSILHTNPAYSVLCQQLEARGLNFDRGEFARVLLAAVPDVNAAAKKMREDRQNATQSRAGDSSIMMTQDKVEHEGAVAGSSGLILADKAHGNNEGEGAASKDKSQSKARSRSKSTGTKAQEKHPEMESDIKSGPPTKVDAARKRAFAEIVDLSQVSDDEDFSFPHFPVFHRPSYSTAPQADIHSLPTGHLSNYGYSTPTLPQSSSLIPSAHTNPPKPPASRKPTDPQTHMNGSVAMDQHAAPQPTNTVVAAPQITQQFREPIVQPMKRGKALLRSAYDPRTIARDVLLATGRHPDMFGLNSHLDILKGRLLDVSNSSDLATLRWDVIDPGSPLPLQRAEDNEVEQDEGGEQDQNNPGLNIAPAPPSNGHVSRAAPEPEQRISDGHDGVSQFQLHLNTPDKKQQQQMPTAPASAGPGVGYAAFTRAAGGPARKGRPVGWRKHLHMKPSSGSSPAASKVRQPSPHAAYKPFVCKWKNCDGKLHNLVTLVKHVQRMHQAPTQDGGFDCLWGACAVELNGTLQRRHYARQEDWWQHLQKVHFHEIKWKQGDGPASGLSDSHPARRSESYLHDAFGRLVTPRVNSPESDTETIPKVTTSISAKGPAAKRIKQALAAEDAARRRKRQIGLGLDKGGCTLANAKRRQGFIDDEDFEQIINDTE